MLHPAGLEDGARRNLGRRSEVGQGRRDRGARRGARLRLGLGLRPLPQRAGAGPRGGVRVLDDDGGHQSAHEPGAPRADGGLRAVSQSGAAGQDHEHRRRDQRRTPRLGHRRRLVRPRVPGLRLRVPRGQGAHRHAARDRRDREGDVVRARRHVRGPLLPTRRCAVRSEAAATAASSDLDRRRRRAAHAARRRPARRPLELRRQAPRVRPQVRGA